MRTLILLDSLITDRTKIDEVIVKLKDDYASATPFSATYEERDFTNLRWVEYQPNALGVAWDIVVGNMKSIYERDSEKWDNIIYVISEEHWVPKSIGGWNLGAPIFGYQVELIRCYKTVNSLYKGFAMEIAHSWNDFCIQETGENLLSTFAVSHFDNQVIHGCDKRYGVNVPDNPDMHAYYTDYNYRPMIEIAKDKLRVAYEKRLKRFLTPVVFKRNLSVGSYGDDVKLLQQFLNGRGYPVSQSGMGSIGNETKFFGLKTRDALALYQKANGINPSKGYFGDTTRAFIHNVLANPTPHTIPDIDNPNVEHNH